MYLFREITSEAEIGDSDVAVFIKEDIGGFQVAVDNIAAMHVLQTQDYL